MEPPPSSTWEYYAKWAGQVFDAYGTSASPVDPDITYVHNSVRVGAHGGGGAAAAVAGQKRRRRRRVGAGARASISGLVPSAAAR